MSYGMITILRIGSLRSPPPIRLRPWTHLRCEGSQGSEGSKGSEGDGIALWVMSIKSALRDLLSVSYDIVSILVISRYAAPPYPAAPDFLHRKACHTILRSLCSLTNRVPLPPHPGDRIKHLEASLRKRLCSKHGLLCPRLRGWQRNWIHRGAPRPANPVTCFPPGKVVAPATKGGLHFLARRAVVKVFAAPGSGI